jgi:hypothetical protein
MCFPRWPTTSTISSALPTAALRPQTGLPLLRARCGLVIYADKLLLGVTSPAERTEYSRKHRPIVERKEQLRQAGRLEDPASDITGALDEGRKSGAFGFGFEHLLGPTQENLSQDYLGHCRVQDDLSTAVNVVNALFAQLAKKSTAQQNLTVEQFVEGAWSLFERGQIRLVDDDTGKHGLGIHYCGEDRAGEQARINQPLVAAWRASSLTAETPESLVPESR